MKSAVHHHNCSGYTSLDTVHGEREREKAFIYGMQESDEI